MKKQKIVIVGGGTSGWVSAAILAKGLPQDKFKITLIESREIATVGVGEATIPPILLLFDYLEIDRKTLLSKVDGTFKYGIHFDGWSKQNESYMHAFGELGTPFASTSFTDIWLKCRANLDIGNLNEFSATAVAAYQNKYHHLVNPPTNANKNMFFPLAGLQYAYQFDAGKLVGLLSNYATNKGVKHVIGTIDTVHNHKNGYIKNLVLSNKNSVSGDVFVDCSGMRGILNQQHYGCEYIDWQHFLPCDSAIPMQTAKLNPLPPYTKSVAMSAGWRWQIPLQTRTGNGYVYSSQFISDDDALKEFESSLSGQEKLNEPRLLRFKTGCLKTPWHLNSIAIGLSSGFFEPLESTSIHLIHKFALQLSESLLRVANFSQEATSFNQNFMASAVSIRDFLIAHYHVNQRHDSAFWRHCREMPIPNSLANILEEFSHTGKITLPKDSLFAYENYMQLLVGQHYMRNYEKFSDQSINMTGAHRFFTNVKAAIKAEIHKIKQHEDYLNDLD